MRVATTYDEAKRDGYHCIPISAAPSDIPKLSLISLLPLGENFMHECQVCFVTALNIFMQMSRCMRSFSASSSLQDGNGTTHPTDYEHLHSDKQAAAFARIGHFTTPHPPGMLTNGILTLLLAPKNTQHISSLFGTHVQLNWV